MFVQWNRSDRNEIRDARGEDETGESSRTKRRAAGKPECRWIAAWKLVTRPFPSEFRRALVAIPKHQAEPSRSRFFRFQRNGRARSLLRSSLLLSLLSRFPRFRLNGNSKFRPVNHAQQNAWPAFVLLAPRESLFSIHPPTDANFFFFNSLLSFCAVLEKEKKKEKGNEGNREQRTEGRLPSLFAKLSLDREFLVRRRRMFRRFGPFDLKNR